MTVYRLIAEGYDPWDHQKYIHPVGDYGTFKEAWETKEQCEYDNSWELEPCTYYIISEEI